MVGLVYHCAATLTGRISVRRGFFGRLVLQVEERLDYSRPFDCARRVTSSEFQWRDARMCDVIPRLILADLPAPEHQEATHG